MVVTRFTEIILLGNGDDGCCSPCIRDYSIDQSIITKPKEFFSQKGKLPDRWKDVIKTRRLVGLQGFEDCFEFTKGEGNTADGKSVRYMIVE